MKMSSLLSLLSALALSACVSLPSDDVTRTAALRTPSAWKSIPDTSAAYSDVPTWWTHFSDTTLNSLIGRAIADNYDLKAAEERVRQAQAHIVETDSRRFPDLNLVGDLSRVRTHVPPPGGIVDDAGIGVAGSWDIDVFGADQLQTLAAQAQAQASIESRRDFAVALAASVGVTYVNLRGLQRQFAILKENAVARSSTVELTRARYTAGLATDLDVARAEVQLEQVEALLPDTERRIHNAMGELAVLTGTAPESADGIRLADGPMPPALPDLPRLEPASLLERRPDLRRAARDVDVAAANLGTAKDELLPKFTLSFGASRDRAAFQGAPAVTDGIFNIGVGIFWPLFNSGRIRADIAAQGSALRQAEDEFNQTLLVALQDVESSYTDVQAYRQRCAELQTAVDAAQRSLQLANELYAAGELDFLAVLDAQTQLLDAQRDLIAAQTNASLASVSLYRALGGGWDTYEPAAAPQS